MTLSISDFVLLEHKIMVHNESGVRLLQQTLSKHLFHAGENHANVLITCTYNRKQLKDNTIYRDTPLE